MKDYRVTVKVRNNRILTRMERRGFATVADLSRAMGCENKQGEIGGLVNLKGKVVDKNGDFYPIVIKMCEVLNAMPADLFSDEQLYHPLENNTADVEVSLEEVGSLLTSQSPLDLLESRENEAILDHALALLPAQSEKILRHRFGIGEEELTLKELGEKENVTPVRIRDIQGKTLSTMRSPRKEVGVAIRELQEGKQITPRDVDQMRLMRIVCYPIPKGDHFFGDNEVVITTCKCGSFFIREYGSPEREKWIDSHIKCLTLKRNQS